MSKLADLLNPEPSPSSSSARVPPPLINSSPSHPHRRNESITSPLEALALAATTAPPLQTSATAVAPPPTTIPPNPYAIKPHFSPSPSASTVSHPPPANPYATSPSRVSPPTVSDGHANSHTPSSPSRLPPSFASPHPRTHIPQPTVKAEMSEEPAVNSVASSHAAPDAPVKSEEPVMSDPPADAPTLAAAALPVQPQGSSMKDEGSATEIKASVEPAPAIKRPIHKKGMAKKATNTSDGHPKKAAPRKRKLEPESSKDGTPFSQRSDTPASRVSKTPGRKNTPQQSSPQPSQDNGSGADDDGEGGDYVDENELFCVCRKPDDHTWMIGCDGGCDDWFHGRCVNMKEQDSELIDKYVCPRCQANGRGKTMWKPMCRLQGCRAPARVTGKTPSKYCSDEHGVKFMREKAYGKNYGHGRDSASRKKRKPNGDVLYDESSSDDGHQPHLRGGVLRPGELKALVNATKDVHEFKRLGERILTTPEKRKKTADREGDVDMEDGEEDYGPTLQLSSDDQARLDAIKKQQADCEYQLELFRDKDKFLNAVKARYKSVFDDMKRTSKVSIKEICGFDTRLSRSEADFDIWRKTDEGKRVLETGVLGAPPKKEGDGDNEDPRDVAAGGLCRKKRCEQHKQWAKHEQNENNLARNQIMAQQRKLDSEESGIKERAMLRQLEAAT